MRARAEDESSASGGGNWSGPFANLMMLLFALFVVLYAATKADVKSLEEETARLQAELQQKKNLPSAATSSGSGASPSEGEMASSALQSGIADAVDALFREANPTARGPQTWVEFEDLGDGAFLLRISPEGLFRPGEARVDSKLRPLLDRLGSLIRKSSRRLKIEGHADYEDSELLSREGGESSTDAMNTWELSARRSAWVAQYWMRKFDFDPQKMEVVAFGKYRPMPAKTQKPSANRRLEIVIEKQ